MTATDNEVDVWEIVGLEESIPCDADKPNKCENPALWKLLTPCCARYVFMCGEHKKLFVDWAMDGWVKDRTMMCLLCGKPGQDCMKFVKAIVPVKS